MPRAWPPRVTGLIFKRLAVASDITEMPDPVLGWYLRDMRNLAWVLAPGAVAGINPPVVITTEETMDALAANYLGSQYALTDHWLPETLGATDAQQASSAAELGFWAGLRERLNTRWSTQWRDKLRWLIYRKVPSAPSTEDVVLWVMAVEEQE